MAGYDYHAGMSNNAVDACERGLLPASKINQVSANLDKIKKRILSQLKWRVEYVEHDGPEMSITSNPFARTHTINLPTGGSWIRETDYIHELCHALLGETVHLFFSTVFFKSGTPDDDIRAIFTPYLTSVDWFVSAVMMKYCSKEESSETIECINILVESLERTDNHLSSEQTYKAGGVVAEAIYYNLKIIQASGDLGPVVNTLLKFNPEQPTLTKLTALTNQLAALTTNCRVRTCFDADLEVWEVYTV